MMDDFNSRWRDACYYTPITTRGARNRQVGIPTYHFWAMLLDPRTKKFIARVLPHEIDRDRLWRDVELACVEIARVDHENMATDPQQQQPGQSENQRKRRKNGAASFFPESDEDEDIKNECHVL